MVLSRIASPKKCSKQLKKSFIRSNSATKLKTKVQKKRKVSVTQSQKQLDTNPNIGNNFEPTEQYMLFMGKKTEEAKMPHRPSTAYDLENRLQPKIRAQTAKKAQRQQGSSASPTKSILSSRRQHSGGMSFNPSRDYE